MTAVGCISDTEEINKPSRSLFQNEGAAAFKFSERTPLPPRLSAKDIPGGRTQIITARQIQRISRHPVESNEDSLPKTILDIKNWLNWNGDLDNPNDSEDDCAADVESNMDQDTRIQHPESQKQQDVSAAPNHR